MAKLKDLPKEDYPREKALKYGFEFLTNSELLAIILSSGTKGENVLELSQKVLSKYEKLSVLAATNIKDLVKIKGINKVKALKLLASLQLSKRLQSELISSLSLSKYNSRQIFEFSVNLLSLREEEVILLLLFDQDGNLSSIKEESTFHDYSVFFTKAFIKKLLINNNFNKIILIHNHLEEDVSPTLIDLESTKRLIEVFKKEKITFLDHIIINKGRYFSFRDNKLLNC